jgi:hypothetical protein
MQRQMVEDGYQNILSTDVSAAAVRVSSRLVDHSCCILCFQGG